MVEAEVRFCGATVRFEAPSDDELWMKMKLFFHGKWESVYYSISDFLEDHGLELR